MADTAFGLRPPLSPEPGAALLERLEPEGLTMLVTGKDNELFRSTAPGVAPLLELVECFPRGLPGATVADRVVGACAARVFAYLRVARVLALVGSVASRAILEAAGVEFEARRGVLEIRNRAGTDTCPFEQLAGHIHRAEELLPAMRRRLTELRNARATG
jgi:hypothetical protein